MSEKGKYHHGNLKAELLEKAESVLISEGIRGLSLRTLARQLGVSEAAPYKHFSNKEQLLEALATEGFLRLRNHIDQAVNQEEKRPLTERLALGYVRFALAHPNLFRLMFGHEISHSLPSPARREAEKGSYQPMRNAISIILAERRNSLLQTEETALGAWSLVHGVATLMIDGKIAIPDDPESCDNKIVALCQSFIIGLYLSPAQ
ncbi:TetR/AcrR family transcriptional regulator [Musicola paradisiaca]|uniref:Transcriptional regulator, TetR family n=1 Tax=Musicola paradisiaca (strain Ech703) TaxID=579405 RepID=C6C9Y8_MUSP7|nr:TetR/AcrR family transcriptional regulator [Musicola paradisiaca]ACS86410.1 transcriptional regulator, TetR family [Musicola paradisiaca Ech703]